MGLMVTEDANADMGPIRTTNSWKSSFTKRRTRDDWTGTKDQPLTRTWPRPGTVEWRRRTFPTAASPSSTNLTLLLGFGAVAVESAIISGVVGGLVTAVAKPLS